MYSQESTCRIGDIIFQLLICHRIDLKTIKKEVTHLILDKRSERNINKAQTAKEQMRNAQCHWPLVQCKTKPQLDTRSLTVSKPGVLTGCMVMEFRSADGRRVLSTEPLQ